MPLKSLEVLDVDKNPFSTDESVNDWRPLFFDALPQLKSVDFKDRDGRERDDEDLDEDEEDEGENSENSDEESDEDDATHLRAFYEKVCTAQIFFCRKNCAFGCFIPLNEGFRNRCLTCLQQQHLQAVRHGTLALLYFALSISCRITGTIWKMRRIKTISIQWCVFKSSFFVVDCRGHVNDLWLS